MYVSVCFWGADSSRDTVLFFQGKRLRSELTHGIFALLLHAHAIVGEFPVVQFCKYIMYMLEESPHVLQFFLNFNFPLFLINNICKQFFPPLALPCVETKCRVKSPSPKAFFTLCENSCAFL
jgi:hypothetical protein